MIVWEVMYHDYDDRGSYGLFATERLAIEKFIQITETKIVFSEEENDYSAYCGDHLIGWGTKEEAETLIAQYNRGENFTIVSRKVQSEE